MATDLVNPSGGITVGTIVATTSGTSIDFTGIPATAKQITLIFNGVGTSGTSIPQIQIGSGSVDATGYTSDAILNSSTGTTATSTTAWILNGANASTYRYKGSVTLYNIGTNIWTIMGVLGTNSGQVSNCGGNKTTSGTLDRVRLTTANGTDTFTAGSINIFTE